MACHVDNRIDVRLVSVRTREGRVGRELTYEGDTGEVPEDDHETPSSTPSMMRRCLTILHALLEEHVPRLRNELLPFSTRSASASSESAGLAYSPGIEVKPRREAHERHVLVPRNQPLSCYSPE